MTPKEIAEWAIKGDFPKGESEAMGIAKVIKWIEQDKAAAVKEAFQKLLDKLAQEYEKPSEDCWDKKMNAGYGVATLWAARRLIETAKEFGIEDLKNSIEIEK